MHVLEKLSKANSHVLQDSSVSVFLRKIIVNIAKRKKRTSETSPTILSNLSHFFRLGNSLLEFLQKRKQIARNASALRQS